ncbi:MAG TPA: Imm51 family immunity protein [Kofleriaceae bacterium]|nr:Imm51 family immunity protein [Kofleriaceae bacterium]
MKPDKAAFEPGILVDHGEGRYSLTYDKFPNFSNVFDPKGLQGGGYTWHGLVATLMTETAPDALEAIDFDPEAGMFVAVSEDLDALMEVAKALRQLEKRDVVERIVATTDLREYD